MLKIQGKFSLLNYSVYLISGSQDKKVFSVQNLNRCLKNVSLGYNEDPLNLS